MFSKAVEKYKQQHPEHVVFDLSTPLEPKSANDFMTNAPWQIRLAIAERTDYFLPDIFPKGLLYLSERENSVQVLAALFKRYDFGIYKTTQQQILNKHHQHPTLLKALEEKKKLHITDEQYDRIISSKRHQLIRTIYELPHLPLNPARIEFAMTHENDSVREAIANRHDWTPTQIQAFCGLTDGDASVVKAWLSRKDTAYTQPELEEAFGNWKDGQTLKNYVRVNEFQRVIIQHSKIKLDPAFITEVLKHNSLGAMALVDRTDIHYTDKQLALGQQNAVDSVSNFFFAQQNRQEREKLIKTFRVSKNTSTPTAL